MTVLGYHVGVTLLLQIATTAVIVAIYSTTASMHEQKDDHVSTCNILLLVAFLFDYHPTIKDLNTVVGRGSGQTAENDDIYYLGPRLSGYLKDGKFPDFSLAAKTSLREHLIALAIAPLAAVGLTILVFQDGRQNFARIRHTEERKNYSSKFMLLLAFNALIAVAGARVLSRHSTLGDVLLIAGLIGVVGSVAGIATIVAQQQAWKSYWGDRLLEIMGVAEHKKDHDLFNRAMILNTYIESQPDIPLPGRLGLYTAVYSSVQAVILFAAKSFHIS